MGKQTKRGRIQLNMSEFLLRKKMLATCLESRPYLPLESTYFAVPMELKWSAYKLTLYEVQYLNSFNMLKFPRDKHYMQKTDYQLAYWQQTTSPSISLCIHVESKSLNSVEPASLTFISLIERRYNVVSIVVTVCVHVFCADFPHLWVLERILMYMWCILPWCIKK